MTAKKKATKRAPANKVKRDLTFADMLEQKERPTIEYPVSVDSAKATARDAAKKAMDSAAMALRTAETLAGAEAGGSALAALDSLRADLTDATGVYEAAKAEAEAVEIVFVLQALSGPVLDRLYKDFPATPAQQKRFKDDLKLADLPSTHRLEFDEDLFPCEMMKRAIKSPECTHSQVEEMYHGPVCGDCDGAYDAECTNPDCVDGRRPDLGKFSHRELQVMWLEASKLNKRVE